MLVFILHQSPSSNQEITVTYELHSERTAFQFKESSGLTFLTGNAFGKLRSDDTWAGSPYELTIIDLNSQVRRGVGWRKTKKA